MTGLEWLMPATRGTDRALRVERRPARGEKRPREVAKGEYFALGTRHRLDRLPYLAVPGEDGELAVAALALTGEDLAVLGFGVFDGLMQHDASEAVLREAVRAAEETSRSRVIVPVTNADLLALLHIQAEGFTLDAITPWAGPERLGVAGIVVTHELVFARTVA